MVAASPAAQLLVFARNQAKTAKNWMELHNQIFGIGGKAFELFPTAHDRTLFVATPEHKQIQQLMLDLGDRKAQSASLESASGKLMLRLPKSLHAALATEAQAEGVSLNQLLVGKLAMQLSALVSAR